MSEKKTHREVKEPQISGRYLADYMAASERARRTIAQKCKYQAIVRVVQHKEAKAIVARFVVDGETDINPLKDKAKILRDRMADDDFERDLYDHNADYIDRFAQVFPEIELPSAEFLPPGKSSEIMLNGVKVTPEIHFRLRRLTTTNKVRVGAAILRYAKGKPLHPSTADWQSAFLFGYLNRIGVKPEGDVEHKLCITLDAYSGKCHPAPTNSASRFSNMEAACASIAERWANIEPPKNAVF